MINEREITLGPFLRWAGSKKSLLNDIQKYLPTEYNNYHEPFLGSGALFFSFNKKENSYLADSNYELINTYKQIRDNVEDVISKLKKYENTEEFYYMLRKMDFNNSVEKAARFIYLNRTCYNGLYRVNSKNQFNVPYGKRTRVDFITEELLRTVSNSLKNVILNSCDFEESLKFVKSGDLVFVDPPYVVAHNNNGFIEYNQNIFSWDDQIRLHNYVQSIIDANAYFILTNSAHASIKELYSDIASPIILERISKIGGKNSYRGIVEEYLFTNTI